MKADGKSKIQETEALRQRAQERLRQSVRDLHALPKESILDLMHELEVHRVELEIQNEELRRASLEVDASRQRYADLYDFAPIGYVTLDHQGVIREANFTATKLLGVEREHLLHRGLHLFVAKGSQEIFNKFLGRVFDGDGQHSCELELVIRGNRSIRERLTMCV